MGIEQKMCVKGVDTNLRILCYSGFDPHYLNVH